MRVGAIYAFRLRQLHIPEQLQSPLLRFRAGKRGMYREQFREVAPDAEQRIEGSARILEHVTDPASSIALELTERELQNIISLEPDRARGSIRHAAACLAMPGR